MYEAKDQDTILQDLRSDVGSDVSSYEGTFAYDVLSSNSIEFAKQEVEREQMYKNMFAETASGEYLDLKSAEFGVYRKAAVAAVAELTVTGTGTIPKGSIFQSATGVTFHSTRETVIDTTGTLEVEADTAGTVGNVPAGTITGIPVSIAGITAVTNPEAAHDGYEEETDDSLLERLLFKVRNPATSGNINDYIEWATGVSGVGHVKVVPLWKGNGTVELLVTDNDGQPASAALITKVNNVVQEKKPIGADVTILAPNVLALTIALTPTKGGGDAEAIKQVLNAYFLTRQYEDTKVSYAKVGQLIIDNSDVTLVEDYDDLTINGFTKNIMVDEDYIPSVVEVTING